MAKSANASAALKEGPRSFAVFVRDAANGTLDTRVSEELHTLAQAIEDEAMKRGKAKGTLTLKIMIDADDQGNGNMKFAVDSKEPTIVNNGGPVWFTKGSNVALEPPGKEVRIRDVSMKRGESTPDPVDEVDGPDGIPVAESSEETEKPARPVRSV
jgi:hypothetical protein